MLLYAAQSSPTPEAIGWVEYMIGALLIIASAPGLTRALTCPIERWQSAAIIALSITTLAPLLTGLIQNNEPANIARDLIAHLYLFLPLFCADLFTSAPKRQRIFTLTLIAMGGLFALRCAKHLNPAHIFAAPEALSYLANAPTVLCAAILCSAYSLNNAPSLLTKPHHSASILCALMITTLTISAITITQQRASLAGFGLITLITLIQIAYKTPHKIIIFILIVAALYALILPMTDYIYSAFRILNEKTSIHGLNKRTEEWHAIYQILAHDPAAMLFGKGWGAGFYSPATDGDFVTFTHSLISALWFKAGLIGLISMSAYALPLARKGLYLLRKTPITALAILVPITIDITLYAAYKSLDFGLMLLAISAINMKIGDEIKHNKPNHCEE